jgi:pyruvate/2-oxoglutarate dehydrogenase complex dihydrolipoamide acyltransferase (E2) component
MATPILVPQLGVDITEAEVTEWLKPEGASVTAGEAIVVLTTPKLTLEIEAPASGTLASIAIADGEIAEVGATLGLIDEG